MFKNKHVIVAMIVAPILGIISYFATDYIVSEKPHIAKKDNIYKMRVKSNCRWESGKCTIDNGDVVVNITGSYLSSRDLKLDLDSSVVLNGVKMAFDFKDAKPMAMESAKPNQWYLTLDTTKQTDKINLVISIKNSIFFAQIPTIFLQKVEKVDY